MIFQIKMNNTQDHASWLDFESRETFCIISRSYELSRNAGRSSTLESSNCVGAKRDAGAVPGLVGG